MQYRLELDQNVLRKTIGEQGMTVLSKAFDAFEKSVRTNGWHVARSVSPEKEIISFWAGPRVIEKIAENALLEKMSGWRMPMMKAVSAIMGWQYAGMMLLNYKEKIHGNVERDIDEKITRMTEKLIKYDGIRLFRGMREHHPGMAI